MTLKGYVKTGQDYLMFGVSYSTIDILPLLSVFNHHHSGLHYHFIIIITNHHHHLASPWLSVRERRRPKVGKRPMPWLHFPITFLYFNSILYFLHFLHALVALSHHHGHHVHHIIKAKKIFVTWQKSNKASAVFSGVSLTGSATFSTSSRGGRYYRKNHRKPISAFFQVNQQIIVI